MMNDSFNSVFTQLSTDDRVTVWHVSIYMAIFFRWRKNAYKNPIPITRREIMRLAHIRSVATYHKCMKQLQEFGYLEYFPSFHPAVGSHIYIKGIASNKGSTVEPLLLNEA
jgi:hypothetical protein